MEEELKGKENEVTDLEKEFKQIITDINKKQLKVDRLNKDFAELSKHGDGDDNSGPMENQKKAIDSKIADLELDCLRVQKDWITNQSALIAFQSEFDMI